MIHELNKIKDIYRSEENGYSTREFEKDVIRLSESRIFNLKDVEKILIDSNYESDINLRFVAFFCLHVYYRRRQSLHDVENLYDKYSKYFNIDVYPYLNQIKLERYTLPGSVVTRNVLDEAKRIATKSNALKDNPGSIHLYCLLLAIYYESNLYTKENIGKSSEIKTALNICKNLIEREKSPRFFDTKGRLETLLGRYDEATHSISQAIDTENTENSDYFIRISEYFNHLCRVETAYVRKEITVLKASRIKIIEVMGLMVAVMTFLIGSLQIAIHYPALEAAGLILVLMGALGIVFCAACFLLRNGEIKTNLAGYITTLVVALLLIAFGLMLCA